MTVEVTDTDRQQALGCLLGCPASVLLVVGIIIIAATEHGGEAIFDYGFPASLLASDDICGNSASAAELLQHVAHVPHSTVLLVLTSVVGGLVQSLDCELTGHSPLDMADSTGVEVDFNVVTQALVLLRCAGFAFSIILKENSTCGFLLINLSSCFGPATFATMSMLKSTDRYMAAFEGESNLSPNLTLNALVDQDVWNHTRFQNWRRLRRLLAAVSIVSSGVIVPCKTLFGVISYVGSCLVLALWCLLVVIPGLALVISALPIFVPYTGVLVALTTVLVIGFLAMIGLEPRWRLRFAAKWQPPTEPYEALKEKTPKTLIQHHVDIAASQTSGGTELLKRAHHSASVVTSLSIYIVPLVIGVQVLQAFFVAAWTTYLHGDWVWVHELFFGDLPKLPEFFWPKIPSFSFSFFLVWPSLFTFDISLDFAFGLSLYVHFFTLFIQLLRLGLQVSLNYAWSILNDVDVVPKMCLGLPMRKKVIRFPPYLEMTLADDIWGRLESGGSISGEGGSLVFELMGANVKLPSQFPVPLPCRKHREEKCVYLWGGLPVYCMSMQNKNVFVLGLVNQKTGRVRWRIVKWSLPLKEEVQEEPKLTYEDLTHDSEGKAKEWIEVPMPPPREAKQWQVIAETKNEHQFLRLSKNATSWEFYGFDPDESDYKWVFFPEDEASWLTDIEFERSLNYGGKREDTELQVHAVGGKGSVNSVERIRQQFQDYHKQLRAESEAHKRQRWNRTDGADHPELGTEEVEVEGVQWV